MLEFVTAMRSIKKFKIVNKNLQIISLGAIILALVFSIEPILAELKLHIEVPVSGLHTRSKTIDVIGTISDTSVAQVKVTFDGATIGETNLQCRNGRFETEKELGSGKTVVSVFAKDKAGNQTESGVVVFMDCTVNTVLGSNMAFVNADEEWLLNPTQLISNRSMVPLRDYCQFFGAQLTWEAPTRKLALTLGRRKTQFQIGSSKAIVDGKPATVDPVPQIIFGSTYVPARFFAQAIGGGVGWHKESKTLSVSVP